MSHLSILHTLTLLRRAAFGSEASYFDRVARGIPQRYVEGSLTCRGQWTQLGLGVIRGIPMLRQHLTYTLCFLLPIANAKVVPGAQSLRLEALPRPVQRVVCFVDRPPEP